MFDFIAKSDGVMLNFENDVPLSQGIMRFKPFFPIYACKQVSVTVISLYCFCSIITFLTMDKRVYGSEPPFSWSTNLSSVQIQPFQDDLVQINETTFFLETQESLPKLDRTLLCAVESYHLENPNEQIVVLINGAGTLPMVPDYLSDVNQIHFRHISFSHFLEESPLGELWNSSMWKQTLYPLNHMSDLLRVAILHKFGGKYIDSDMIALKAFPKLNDRNVVVGVEKDKVGSAYMQFQKSHPFLEQTMAKLVRALLFSNAVTFIHRLRVRIFQNFSIFILGYLEFSGLQTIDQEWGDLEYKNQDRLFTIVKFILGS